MYMTVWLDDEGNATLQARRRVGDEEVRSHLVVMEGRSLIRREAENLAAQMRPAVGEAQQLRLHLHELTTGGNDGSPR